MWGADRRQRGQAHCNHICSLGGLLRAEGHILGANACKAPLGATDTVPPPFRAQGNGLGSSGGYYGERGAAMMPRRESPQGHHTCMYHSDGVGHQAPWGCRVVMVVGRISSSASSFCLRLPLFVTAISPPMSLSPSALVSRRRYLRDGRRPGPMMGASPPPLPMPISTY